MSRIGKLPISIPAGVTVAQGQDGVVTVKGPKGELKQAVNPNIKVEIEDGNINVSRPDDNRESRAQHGLFRALINNMVTGVSTGFKKELEIVGVGYKAESKGQSSRTAWRCSISKPLQVGTSGTATKFAPRCQEQIILILFPHRTHW